MQIVVRNPVFALILILFATILSPCAHAVVSVLPDNPKIAYSGRADFANPANPAFSFPGTQIKIRFTGTSLKVRMNVTSGDSSYHTVLVDDQASRKIMFRKGGVAEYTVCTGLAAGTHDVTLFRLNEGWQNVDKFSGFLLDDGASVLDPTPFTRLTIEVVGDSWTAAWGNEDSARIMTERPQYTNNYLAWGAVLARMYGMRYSCVAVSGAGMISTDPANPTIPTFYNYATTVGSTPAWDHNRYHPDIVVVFAGINDYWDNPPDSTSYRKLFSDLYTHIKTKHPDAVIVGLTGNVHGTAKDNNWAANIAAAINTCTPTFGARSFRQYKLPATLNPPGGLYHPSVASHKRFADSLGLFLAPVVDSLQKARGVGVGFTTRMVTPSIHQQRTYLDVTPGASNGANRAVSGMVHDLQGKKIFGEPAAPVIKHTFLF